MSQYTDSPEWEDIVPVTINSGGSSALANIAYTDEYSTALSYLMALIALNETSERAMALTEDIIDMNPSHYTAWTYRAKVLFALAEGKSEVDTTLHLEAELDWLNDVSLQNLKNYQIWSHRQTVMGRCTSLPSTELDFLEDMLSRDFKNYHVWTYRQWLMRKFSLWEMELPYIQQLIHQDVMNNSAWNHRWVAVFGRYLPSDQMTFNNPALSKAVPAAVLSREVSFAQTKIRLAPQNLSAWNYYTAVLRISDSASADLTTNSTEFAETFANVDDPTTITSSHALAFLARLYAENGERARANTAFDLLIQKYDPIRKNYWNYQKSMFGPSQTMAEI